MIRRYPLVTLSLLFALFAAGPALSSGFDDARRIAEMAEDSSLQNRLAICQEILDGKPVPWARSFCEGYVALASGNQAAAKLALDEALAERTDFGLGAILYGDLAAETGRLDAAVEFYNRALAVQPARVDARFSLGSVLFRLGREQDPKYFTQALEAFRSVAEADPESPDGWSHMGLVLGQMGRYADAEAMYRKAIERNPSDPFLYDGLASLFARQDMDGPAADNWSRAISLSPGYGPAIVELAALEARNNRLEQAISVLENAREAAKVAPWGARIRRELGFAYLRIGMEEVARIRLEEAAKIGGDPLASLGLGHLRMIAQDEAGAVPAFEEGAEMDSTLAAPFVRAWREPLTVAVQGNDAAPGIRRVLQGLDRPQPGHSATGGRTAPKDLRGAAATNALAEFALPGWSFSGADQAKEALRHAPADSLGNQFDTPPVPLKQVPVEYPEAAEAAGLTGTVQVLVTVDENGRVVEAREKICEAPRMLCDAAVAAARKWTFQPATRYGHPVRAIIMVPFRFRVQGR